MSPKLEMTEGVKEIHELIREHRPKINDTSLTLYVSHLLIIFRDYTQKPREEFKGKDDLKFLLEDSKKVMELLESKYKQTTLRNFYNSVVVYLKCFSLDIPDKKAFAAYEMARDTLNNDYLNRQTTNDKSDNQKNNWIDIEEYDKVMNYYHDIVKREKLFEKSPDELKRTKEFFIIQSYIVLLMYKTFHLRNDLGSVLVFHKKKGEKNPPSNKNYLIVNNARNQVKYNFIINQHKTAKTHGPITLVIRDKNMIKTLTNWLKINDTGFFLTNTNFNKPIGKDLSRYIISIFKKRLNKNIGPTMLRHIFLSEKYGDVLDEMKKDSEVMGHSLKTQQQIYIKN